jgi:DNA-binding CsgD family transcriptional regulator
MDWYRAFTQAMLARVRLYTGDPAGCVELLLKAGGGPELSSLATARGFWYHLLAAAEAARGDATAAGGWAERAQAAADSRLTLPLAFAYLARANALAASDPVAAAAVALRAAARFDGVGAHLYAGQATLCAAVAFGSAGQFGQARRAFGRARALFEACGANLYHAEAVREERRMNSRRPRRTRAARPADGGDGHRVALTDRELEVAQMVTSGLTNHQIARRLFVSPRTIEAHLHRIFAKLGVRSRAAVAGVLAAAGGSPGGLVPPGRDDWPRNG